MKIFKILDCSNRTIKCRYYCRCNDGYRSKWEIEEPIATAVEVINDSDAVVVAVDIPTGMRIPDRICLR